MTTHGGAREGASPPRKDGTMTKPGYYQLRITEENDAQIRAICDRLGIDPNEWGAYSKAIKFALRVVTTRLVEWDHDSD